MTLVKIKILIQILSYVLNFSISKNGKNKEISFVIDFMTEQVSPKPVLEHLCWRREDTRILQKLLTRNNYRYRTLSKNVTKFEEINNPHFYTVLVSLECNFESFLETALKTPLSRYPNVWIIFGDIEKLKKSNLYIPINSLFLLPVEDRTTNLTKIKTIYKINKDVYYVEKDVGIWSPNRHIYIMESIHLIRDRNNFLGMPLRVSYIVTDNGTLNHFTDYRDKYLDNLTKINYILYDFVCDLLNATQVRQITNHWGFETENGGSTFSTGMFEDLVYDRCDVAGTVSFTPASRLKYFRYIFAPIKDFSLHFAFRAPSLAYYTNLFALPFSYMVWLTIALILIFCSILIFVILRWEMNERAFAQEREENRENAPNLLDVIMMQIGIVCQMDIYYIPKSLSGKIATLIVLITFTFIYTAFSARIVLLIQSNTNKIKNLDSLYATNFDFGVENQLYNKFYFELPSARADEYWRKIIYENKIKKSSGDRFLSAADGMKLVRDTYFAFHVERTVANYLIEKTFSQSQKCSLQFVETIYKSDIPHLAIPRNSSYIEFLIMSFRRLGETGVHNREYRRCFTMKPTCEGKVNIFVSVGLVELYFPFVVFFSGICLSITLLILEVLVYNHLKIRCML